MALVTGTMDADRLVGTSASDTLLGLEGNDRLIGGPGSDILNGGDGFDFAVYNGATQNISVNTRNGQFLGAAAGDQYISIEALSGTQFGDSLIMGDGDNTILGRGGDDFLDGGNGNDKLIGGAGADFLHGGNGIDTAIYRASNEGVNISLTSGWNIGGHAQGDVLSWIHNVNGSLHDDTIEGDILNNRLWGFDGDDTLIGRGGQDVLRGGAGADSFVFVTLDDHVATTQSEDNSIRGYAGQSGDKIRDFTPGEDKIQLASDAFFAPLFNTDQMADLGLNDSSDQALAFHDGSLFFVRYANEADFAAGTVTLHHLADLTGVAQLTTSDLIFV